MEDNHIVELYYKRDENAIHESEIKYSRYLTKIAHNIVADFSDCEEIVNDTLLRAWNSIPPHMPSILSTYLGKITRQAAIDCLRKKTNQKRAGSEYTIALSELHDCISENYTPEQELEGIELATVINTYIHSLSAEARHVFIGRYYFMDPIHEIAVYCHFSESKVKSLLFRARNGLRLHLEKEGFFV